MDWARIVAEHGYWVVLIAVLADQSGLPLPAAPALVVAGALVRDGMLSPTRLMLVAIGASLAGHTAWFLAGRRGGVSVLRQVCRLALEPEACVKRTQDLFTRMGPISLLVGRFIPGLDTMAQPLAGMSGMPLQRYLVLSSLGAIMWAGTFMGIGALFGPELHEALAPLYRLIGPGLGALFVFGFVAYVGNKLRMRYRTLRKVRMRRITVDELKTRMDAGESLVVFDLRNGLEQRFSPDTIPGAVSVRGSNLEARLRNVMPEQEVVVFCNCPYELASARMAARIVRQGHARVRPLLGGLDAWQERHYPTVPLQREGLQTRPT